MRDNLTAEAMNRQERIDNHILKLTGTAYLEAELPRGKTLILAGEFQESKREEVPNEDGTVNMYYKVKPLRIMRTSEGGENIPLKAKNNNSVRIRAAVMREHPNRKNVPAEPEELYDQFTDKLTHNMPAVLDLLGL